MDEAAFRTELENIAQKTEIALTACLEHAGQAPQELMDALRYGSLAGGKRFRPFLVHASASLFTPNPQLVQRAALAVEFIHCYSLIHDDLPAMDNDELRRGRPTLWKASNEATAILAGDALLTLAFEVLSSPSDGLTPGGGTQDQGDAPVLMELTYELAVAAGKAGMVGGQMRDLAAEGQDLGEAAIRQYQAMKTGALIRFSTRAGAILGRGNGAEKNALTAYGEALGAAFQLSDDLLDIEGDEEQVGKNLSTDEDAGKATLISLKGVDQSRALLRQLEQQAIDHVAPFGANAAPLIAAAHFVAKRSH